MPCSFTFPTSAVDQGTQPAISTMFIISGFPQGKGGRRSLIIGVESVEAEKEGEGDIS